MKIGHHTAGTCC